MDELYDVIAVSIRTGAKRIMARGLSTQAADDYINMAVYRRGVEEEFFTREPAGSTPAVSDTPPSPNPSDP